MELYERLIQIIDAYITTFDGAMRLHGIQALLLVQKATRFGNGISPSDIHRLTGAPLENIRRRFRQFGDQGLIAALPDPQDDRSKRCTMTPTGLRTWPAEDIARALHPLRPPGHDRAEAPQPLGPETYDMLFKVLEAFATALDPSMRIRGFKTALLIQQATISGRGITTSALSRQTNAALETVRRHMAKHTALGDLTLVEDPEDDRATLVFTAHPDRESRSWSAAGQRLDALDWHPLNLR